MVKNNRTRNRVRRRVARRPAAKRVKREINREVKVAVNRAPPRRANNNRRPRNTTWAGLARTYGPRLGALASDVVRDITGFGDYKVSKNTLLSGGQIPQVANFKTNGGIMVTHAEYLGDLVSSTGFVINTYPVNPGMSSFLVWLSGIAASFEEYDLHGMVVIFKSTSSNAIFSSASSTALGTVIIATQYDPLDEVFPNKLQMLNYQYATSANPSSDIIHPIECANSQTTIPHRYVRSEPVPVGADIRLYDWGRLCIATTGMQVAGGVIGEIWISYQVELFKPKLPVGLLSSDAYYAHYTIAGALAATPFGVVTQIQDDIPLLISGTTITFPASLTAATFFLCYQVTGTAAVINGPVISATSGAILPIFKGASIGAVYSPANGVSSVVLLIVWCFQITGAGATITFGAAGTIPTATTSGDLFAIQVPDNIKILPSLTLENPFNPLDFDDPCDEDDWLQERFSRFCKLEGIKHRSKSK